MTDNLCWFSLIGETVEEALKQGSFLTFDPAGIGEDSAKRTMIAGVTAIIVREDALSWSIGIERSRARYFHDWLRSLSLV